MRISVIKKSILIAYYTLLSSGFVTFGLIVYATIIKKEPLPLILFFAAMSLLSLSAVIWDMNNGLGSQYFIIDSEGVSYIKKRNVRFTIRWEKVAVIALAPDGCGHYSTKSFVIFAIRDDALLLLSNRDHYNEDVVGVQYRKGLVDLIKQYTDIPIRFIDTIEP